MNPGPHLVFEKTARYQLLLPQMFSRTSIFGEQMRQGDRAIEIDQDLRGPVLDLASDHEMS
jgi:hypothetical protein